MLGVGILCWLFRARYFGEFGESLYVPLLEGACEGSPAENMPLAHRMDDFHRIPDLEEIIPKDHQNFSESEYMGFWIFCGSS